MDALLILLRHRAKHLQSGMKSVKVLAQKRPIIACHTGLIDNPPHIKRSFRFIPREVNGKFATPRRERDLRNSLAMGGLSD